MRLTVAWTVGRCAESSSRALDRDPINSHAEISRTTEQGTRDITRRAIRFPRGRKLRAERNDTDFPHSRIHILDSRYQNSRARLTRGTTCETRAGAAMRTPERPGDEWNRESWRVIAWRWRLTVRGAPDRLDCLRIPQRPNDPRQ